MPTLLHSIEAVPVMDAGRPGDGVLRLRSDPFDVTCTLRRVDGPSEQNPATLAAVLADLLRPGWDEIARPLTVPIVRHGHLYRGFRMERLSRRHGGRWEIAAVVPARMEDDFDWSALTEFLDNLHATIHAGASGD